MHPSYLYILYLCYQYILDYHYIQVKCFGFQHIRDYQCTHHIHVHLDCQYTLYRLVHHLDLHHLEYLRYRYNPYLHMHLSYLHILYHLGIQHNQRYLQIQYCHDIQRIPHSHGFLRIQWILHIQLILYNLGYHHILSYLHNQGQCWHYQYNQ